MNVPEKQPDKLKIAQVIDVYEFATNGATISTQRFTQLLRDHGHKVIVVSTGRPEQDKVVMKEYYPPTSYIQGILKRMKFVFAVPDKKLLEEVIAGTDIVHNQLPFLLGVRAIQVARQFGKPVISTFHVQGEQITFNGGLKQKFWTELAYKYFIRYIYNRSDLVICPSAFAEREIKRYGLNVPTVVISNGVPPQYRAMPLPSRYPGKFTILTVGRNAMEKRQEMLIRAVAASSFKDKIQVIILGDGPLRSALESLSRELLDGQVEFNLLPTEKVIEYYNSVDLYVHAAEVEVECMTAIEAMACGLPLLIAESDLSATSQFALNEKHLFTTTEELRDKIDYWISHPEELRDAKTEYLEFSKQYAIDRSYEKLEETYYQALNNNASASSKMKEPLTLGASNQTTSV